MANSVTSKTKGIPHKNKLCKARQNQRCDICHGWIKPGEYYYDVIRTVTVHFSDDRHISKRVIARICEDSNKCNFTLRKIR